MEGIGIPKIKHGEEKREKNPFEILTAELAGKTRDELTPEQREAEDVYCDKAFRDLMQLINDDKVLRHSTSESNIISVLQHGLVSYPRTWILGINTGSGSDARAQKNASIFVSRVIPRFFDYYRQWKEKVITDEDFYEKREEIINQFPETGKERAEYYFKEILPKGLEERWFSDTTYATTRRGWQSMNLSQRKQYVRENKKFDLVGEDTISTTNTYRIKREIVRGVPYHPLGDTIYGVFSIFFDRPSSKKVIDLGMFYGGARNDKEEDSIDTGVIGKINKNNFRALEFGTGDYDKAKRTLYCDLALKEVSASDIFEILIEKQRKGFLCFADSFIPLPPLESIKIVTVKPEDQDELRCLQADNPQKTNEKIKSLITENHWDWYEKYGKKEE